MSAFDDYFDGLDDQADRAALEHVRAVALAEAPDAQEGTSYGLPALKLGGKPLLGVLAARHHLSVFPFSPRVIDALRDRLADHELSKGTVRFTPGKPIPDEVLREIVRLRRAEIAG